MKDVLKELKKKKDMARLSGGLKRLEAQHSKGKLSARERINVLADKDTFIEYDMFVEHRFFLILRTLSYLQKYF